ncbi:Lytic transglycosylase protein [Azotobacter vinelandii CA]|uniref:Lytic transglycosylase protein n=2 Tax=Azotobacter vinelandii TaxID=354 RepID=C1DGH9_AZOVD|nr:transglycosylase SLT domain-containing protein [Azotobacter vinelandii]ACO78490.1 Lytic transglycosylase protein [Azotobacter vinelandii DJ]AGK14987.1 Lytic transglycosylase protein [Azotobacter vinelandii CA]AGK20552.1 Lytic transglycosylase protein [Azotobacter vinelandii CA6]SFX60528.1 Membrane-bound lytic murein transglycosylase MltF [Azotobacter vinelandii]GLK61532.1 lytic transglycosylase F [Azotobacter vinelandii]
MTTRRLLLLSCLLSLLPLPAAARLAGPPEAWQRPGEVRDLPQVRSSGVLRVLVNQSRNSSGEVNGQPIGVEYRRLRAFEQYLNRTARDGRSLRLEIIPRAKDQLISALQRGEGDLVAPGELVHLRGRGDISPSAPIMTQVPLVLVGRKGARRYRQLDQLSGKTLVLPAGSAVGAAVHEVNEQLAARKLRPIGIEWLDPSLAVEDVLEMVQAGIYPLTAVELPIAQRWAKVLPKLQVQPEVAFSHDDDLSWFIRRDAHLLRASIDRFFKDYRSPADQDAVFQRVYRRLFRVHNPLGGIELRRLEKVRPVLQQYAERNGLDWLNLAAVAYKESTLNPAARGAGNATGLMQVTPAAARSVGVGDIHRLENNVRASARYLASLRRQFFSSPRFNERERMAFTLAAYNIGPQRVQHLRAEAKRRGLNPDQWFFQVERVAAEQVGMGVVSYVNNVNKYFLAFHRERSALESQQRVASRADD